ncbi:hypothetical protein PCE1_000656 [Barthelona sp. PCE]
MPRSVLQVGQNCSFERDNDHIFIFQEDEVESRNMTCQLVFNHDCGICIPEIDVAINQSELVDMYSKPLKDLRLKNALLDRNILYRVFQRFLEGGRNQIFVEVFKKDLNEFVRIDFHTFEIDQGGVRFVLIDEHRWMYTVHKEIYYHDKKLKYHHVFEYPRMRNVDNGHISVGEITECVAQDGMIYLIGREIVFTNGGYDTLPDVPRIQHKLIIPCDGAPYFDENHPLMGRIFFCVDRTPENSFFIFRRKDGKFLRSFVDENTRGAMFRALDKPFPSKINSLSCVCIFKEIFHFAMENIFFFSSKDNQDLRVLGDSLGEDLLFIDESVFLYQNGEYHEILSIKKFNCLFFIEKEQEFYSSKGNIPYMLPSHVSITFFDFYSKQITVFLTNPQKEDKLEKIFAYHVKDSGQWKFGHAIIKNEMFEMYLDKKFVEGTLPIFYNERKEIASLYFNSHHCVTFDGFNDLLYIDKGTLELPRYSSFCLQNNRLWTVTVNKLALRSLQRNKSNSSACLCDEIEFDEGYLSIFPNPYDCDEVIITHNDVAMFFVSYDTKQKQLVSVPMDEVCNYGEQPVFLGTGIFAYSNHVYDVSDPEYVVMEEIPECKGPYIMYSPEPTVLVRLPNKLDDFVILMSVFVITNGISNISMEEKTISLKQFFETAELEIVSNFGSIGNRVFS